MELCVNTIIPDYAAGSKVRFKNRSETWSHNDFGPHGEWREDYAMPSDLRFLLSVFFPFPESLQPLV